MSDKHCSTRIDEQERVTAVMIEQADFAKYYLRLDFHVFSLY
jgi:hypothetical protein